MSRWHREHPDFDERGSTHLDALTDRYDRHDGPSRLPLAPCVACGRPTRMRWCSEACFVAEDGPPEEDY